MRGRPTYVPIEGEPDLVRDPKTRAILQTNVNAKKAYQIQRSERLRIKNALSEIDDMKADMKDMKSLMQAILEKLS